MGEMLFDVRSAQPLGLALALCVGGAVASAPGTVWAKGPKYQHEDGTTDPRVRPLPRRHRFRLAIDGGHIRLTSAQTSDGTDTVRFHWAPLLLDASYQMQFAKVLMIRPGFAAGMNVGNSRWAMPAVFSPRFFTGYQGRHAGIAAGYVYYAVGYPGLTVENGADGRPDSIGGPRIWSNHGVLGELSFTSRIDAVAITFAFRIGGVHSHIQHYTLDSTTTPALRKFRPHWGLSLGFFFDGTIRRNKAARARAETEL